jgi:hypothetical protein
VEVALGHVGLEVAALLQTLRQADGAVEPAGSELKAGVEIDVRALPEAVGVFEALVDGDLGSFEARQRCLDLLRRDVAVGEGVDQDIPRGAQVTLVAEQAEQADGLD